MNNKPSSGFFFFNEEKKFHNVIRLYNMMNSEFHK